MNVVIEAAVGWGVGEESRVPILYLSKSIPIFVNTGCGVTAADT